MQSDNFPARVISRFLPENRENEENLRANAVFTLPKFIWLWWKVSNKIQACKFSIKNAPGRTG